MKPKRSFQQDESTRPAEYRTPSPPRKAYVSITPPGSPSQPARHTASFSSNACEPLAPTDSVALASEAPVTGQRQNASSLPPYDVNGPDGGPERNSAQAIGDTQAAEVHSPLNDEARLALVDMTRRHLEAVKNIIDTLLLPLPPPPPVRRPLGDLAQVPVRASARTPADQSVDRNRNERVRNALQQFNDLQTTVAEERRDWEAYARACNARATAERQ